LPVGHDAKGLVLPDFDVEGRLRGKFVAGSAKRVDENHIDFNDLKNEDVLIQDQLLFLQRKRKSGAQEYHMVQSGTEKPV